MAGKFVLKASSGQEFGRSHPYDPESGCRNGIRSVAARNAPTAGVVLPD